MTKHFSNSSSFLPQLIMNIYPSEQFALCQDPQTMSSPVLGVYDRMEVRPSTVFHSGRELPITWINRFAFYFQWDNKGNEQVWIYNSKEDCLHQICERLDANILQSKHSRHSGSRGNIFVSKELGYFNGTTVHENHVRHSSREVDISWINPLSFYFKWADGNEQVWLYDGTLPGYLQFGMWAKSVQAAMKRDPTRVHRLS